MSSINFQGEHVASSAFNEFRFNVSKGEAYGYEKTCRKKDYEESCGKKGCKEGCEKTGYQGNR